MGTCLNVTANQLCGDMENPSIVREGTAKTGKAIRKTGAPLSDAIISVHDHAYPVERMVFKVVGGSVGFAVATPCVVWGEIGENSEKQQLMDTLYHMKPEQQLLW